MKEEILVSVITVCYNSEKTIRATLESVLNQTYQNFEYIVIDGKSSDHTLEIVTSYESCFEGRMKVFSEPDKGIYDAMNKGISKAKGKLIGMINSDDWYEPDAIKIMVEQYDDKQYEILYGMQREFEGDKEKVCWIKRHEFLESQMITHPTCFVTKDLYEQFGKYDLKYCSSADYDFMLRMFYNKEVIFKPVYEIIANFRLGGMSGNNIGRIETEKIRYYYGISSRNKLNRVLFVNYSKIFVKKILKVLHLR